MVLTTTLSMAAAAAVINIWLGMRIGTLRHKLDISVGDGGNELMTRRMRAQLNFVENAPLTLILCAAVEIAGKGGAWLAPLMAVFMIGRITHAIGMDGGFKAGRPIGFLTALVANIGLAVVAVLVSLGKM